MADTTETEKSVVEMAEDLEHLEHKTFQLEHEIVTLRGLRGGDAYLTEGGSLDGGQTFCISIEELHQAWQEGEVTTGEMQFVRDDQIVLDREVAEKLKETYTALLHCVSSPSEKEERIESELRDAL